MKKFISVILALLICLTTFSGCGLNTYTPLQYTHEILINKESPDSSLVWAGRIETPTAGISIIEFPDSSFFGIISQSNIQEIKSYRQNNYVKSKEDIPQIYKILKMSKEELRKKFNIVPYEQDVSIWEDVILFHFHVPEDNMFNGELTEFAGKFVFIEYREKEDTSYLQALTPEEYHNYGSTAPRDSDRGRVGNKCYFTAGYYDLSEHTYKVYSDKSDLPLYSGFEFFPTDIIDKLKENDVLKEHISKGMLLGRGYIIKDRLYITIASSSRYYHSVNDEKVYEGSDLLVIMLDYNSYNTNYEILYAEKYHSSNYDIGVTGLVLYQIGKDGLLYEPYVK